jgi:hypothetical protein
MKFRPRFTVRTLVIFVTIVCAYFGVWEATKRSECATPNYKRRPWYRSIDDSKWLEDADSKERQRGFIKVFNVYSPAALIIARVDCTIRWDNNDTAILNRYYLWLFGPTVKLPYESTWQ